MTVHTTTSLFLVVADQEPRHVDLAGIGSWLVSAVFRACDSPLDPREIRAYADWDGPDPPPTTYHAVLSAVAPANRQPRSAQITRAFARTIAAQSGGLLIDWVTREIVLAASQPERASFHLGDQWLGFEHPCPRRTTSVAVRGGVCRAPPPDPRVGEVRPPRDRHRPRRLRQPSGGTQRAQGARPAPVLGPPSRSGSARVEGRVRRVLGLDIGRRQRLHRHSCRTGRRPLGRWPTRRATQRLARRPRGESPMAGGLPSRRLLDIRPARGVHRRPGAGLSVCSDFAASCQVIADHS